MDGLLLLLTSSDSGTSMPTESLEESIPSMKQTSVERIGRSQPIPGWADPQPG
jgi:hypothetical protein